MKKMLTSVQSNVTSLVHVFGPDFILLQVHELEPATVFYQQQIGLKRAPTPDGNEAQVNSCR